jgi:hypothetical protein
MRVTEAVKCHSGLGADILIGTVEVGKKTGTVIPSFHNHGPMGGFL